jgi:hypothetical protein
MAKSPLLRQGLDGAPRTAIDEIRGEFLAIDTTWRACNRDLCATLDQILRALDHNGGASPAPAGCLNRFFELKALPAQPFY